MNNQIFLLMLLLLNGAVTRNINSHFIEKNIIKSKNENKYSTSHQNLYIFQAAASPVEKIPTKADDRLRQCLESWCYIQVQLCTLECQKTLTICRVEDSYQNGNYPNCISHNIIAEELVDCIKRHCGM